MADVDVETPTAPTGRDHEVMVRARGLVKRFGDFTAVDGIDVEIQRGEAFGFLGPNGAGKSSTMRMIGCVSPPTGGELAVLGRDPRDSGPQIRARLGVVPQQDSLDTELTVRDNLLIYARYFGIPRSTARRRADELLEFAQLSDRADSIVEPLSGGMKRRLTIARALVNQPELLLLDEPTTGLDPQARHVLWDRLFRLKQQGVTLVLTTHYMDEAEQLCDRLVVMDGGRIVAQGSPRSLIEEWSTREVLELRFADEDHAPYAPQVQDLAERVEVLPDRLLLYAHDGEGVLGEVQRRGLRPAVVAGPAEQPRGRLPAPHRPDAGGLSRARSSRAHRRGRHAAGRGTGRRLAAVARARLPPARLAPAVGGHRLLGLPVPAALPGRDGLRAGQPGRPRRPAGRGRAVPRVRDAGGDGGDGDADGDRRVDLAGPVRHQVAAAVPRDAGDAP